MKKENIRDGIILVVLLIASGLFTWYLGDYFGIWYAQIFNLGFHTFAVIMGFPIAYLLFIFFTVRLFIPRANPYIYAVIFLPGLLFSLLFSSEIFVAFFPFLFAVVGYLLALLVNWMIHLIKR